MAGGRVGPKVMRARELALTLIHFSIWENRPCPLPTHLELALLESMRPGELAVALGELARAVLENSPLCYGYRRDGGWTRSVST